MGFGLFAGKRERLRRRASAWLARLQGPADAADKAAFRDWYEADPAHAAAFDRVAARQELGDLLAGTEFARANRLPHTPRKPRPRLHPLAAGLAVILAAAAVMLLGRPDGLMPRAEAQVLFFATEIGEIRRVSLADGTLMILDTGTAVEVELESDLRRVTLKEGRARFAVAADARPFLVRAGRSRVSARNATFDVELRPGTVRVQPVEGPVSVAEGPETSPVQLAPGQAVAIPAADGRAPEAAALSPALWPSGRLDFDAAPLDAVLAEANRYSRGQIGLADPALARLRVSGTFRAGDLEGLARALEAAFGLRLERSAGGHLVLHPSGAHESGVS